MNLQQFAENELLLAGYFDTTHPGGGSSLYGDDMVREAVLELLEVFRSQGHSGHSAPYILSIFHDLAKWKPLSPLLGDESEWAWTEDNFSGLELGELGRRQVNRRCSSVFRDTPEGSAYDVNSHYCKEPDGTRYYSGRKCRRYLTFPYMPGESTAILVDFDGEEVSAYIWTQMAAEYERTKDGAL